MKEVYTPTKAREKLFDILKDVNSENKPVLISSTTKEHEDAVVIGKDDWNAIQETLFLTNTGVTKQIKDRENDDFIDFDQAWKEI
ncbi:type II toxin-antitoxin system Phd/YefM family antitoxin [Companilactobacillus formosensis]|jgi:prevent-host-death family protein|uniref:type II toxin-antitoxin system Phd/YefM family antitoxin n=1 Tax=Companilactobacillus formosensis TaxID=1617889 RepID=UPI000E65C399|nr:type II toxin-antitoxin system prevent-host-death family antitoxin [Companilactobacillus formosensis]